MARIVRKTLRVIAVLVVIGLASLAITVSYDSPCGPTPTPTANSNLMKAMVYGCYGSPDVVKLADVQKPTPVDDQVLVKVHAAAVNPLDYHYVHGTPYIIRLESGIGSPTNPRLGVDFAGTVEAVGKSVTHFRPGDEVFGGRTGAFGEYVTVRESRAVVLKPTNMTFEQAAAVPIAAVTALQALRDYGKIQSGQKVLINGASGGVGTFAVQIAKSFGAEVTGVCSGRNTDMVRNIGADFVVDYTKEDFTQGDKHYDLIIDTVGTHGLLEYKRVLNPKGIYVLVGGPVGNWLSPWDALIKTSFLSPFVSQTFVWMIADLNQADLGFLHDLMQAGKLTPVIDRTYPLSAVPDAIHYVEQGHARGKVVIDLDSVSKP